MAPKGSLQILSFLLLLCFISASKIDTTSFGTDQSRYFPEWTDRIELPEGWTQLNGEVAENTQIELTLGLKIRNADKLEEKFWSVSDPDNPDYGNYMSLDELASMISPLPSDISVVRAWLLSHGVTELRSVVTNDFVTVVAPVRVVQEMFQVTLRHFKHHSRKSDSLLIRSPVPYSIPVELSSIIDIVFGLTNFPGQRPVIHLSKRAVGQAPNVTPLVIKETLHIYNTTGTGRKDNAQAVVQFLKEYYSPDDLSTFLSQYGLPDQKVKVIGTNNPNYPGLEASLDIEYIIGTATNVDSWFYEVDGKNSGDLFLKWMLEMNNETLAPTVASVSYVEGENELHHGYVTKCNLEFIKAGVRGITILFSSGDAGTGCATECDKFIVNWPASSPYVTSVGGVYLANASPYQVQGDAISGGGFSNRFTAPSYQTKAIAKYLSSTPLPPSKFYNVTGRGVPDIAAYSENVIVQWGGSQIPVQGTSCASPIAAGVFSLINDALLTRGKKPIGFFNPLLYKLAPANGNAVFDVTTGSNPYGCCPGFSCAKGWDPVTGWGVPMFEELRDAIFKYLKVE